MSVTPLKDYLIRCGEPSPREPVELLGVNLSADGQLVHDLPIAGIGARHLQGPFPLHVTGYGAAQGDALVIHRCLNT